MAAVISLPLVGRDHGWGPHAQRAPSRPNNASNSSVSHPNTIEGFWGPFKRGIVGSYKVSAKYPPLYIAEFQFRYNNRGNADIFGTAIKGA